MALAMVAPAPGKVPMTKPARALRTMVQNVMQNSLKLNSKRPLALTAFCPLWVFSSISSTSLTLYNITPGPLLFEQQPDVVWGLIASLFIGNVILLVMNIPLVGLFSKMLSVPNWVLVPAITAISLVGVYSVHSTTFDLVLMVGLGVFGYLLRKLEFPLSSLILGFVLGEMMEDNLRRALSISAGDLGILWGSPITLILWALAALMLAMPGLRWWRQRRRTKLNEAHV